MTGHLIGQFQHPKVKVISVNTRHGDQHRIATKTFRERVPVGTMRMIGVSPKYYQHWPMIFLRYREHMNQNQNQNSLLVTRQMTLFHQGVRMGGWEISPLNARVKRTWTDQSINKQPFVVTPLIGRGMWYIWYRNADKHLFYKSEYQISVFYMLRGRSSHWKRAG